MNTLHHGVLALGVTASVEQLLERVVYSDAHISVEGMKLWNILSPETGEEIAFMFNHPSETTTTVYMERPEDNLALPDFIHPQEVVWMSLNGGEFPKADKAKVYFWNEPEHEAEAVTVNYNAVNGGATDPEMVGVGRPWFVSLKSGDPVTGLPILHRLAHLMRLGAVLPAAVEVPVTEAIARISEGDGGGHDISFMVMG